MPGLLATLAAWSWRMLLIGGATYAGVWVLSRLALVVLPFIAALLITALLRPVVVLFRRWMPRAAAAWLTLVFGVVVIGGIGYLIGLRAAAEWPSLVTQLIHTARQLQNFLSSSSLNIGGGQLAQLQGKFVQFLQQNRGQVANIVSQGAGYAAEFATGLVLTVFIMFFLLHDGEGIWRWLLRPFSGEARDRVDRAGRIAWDTITGYVHGTAVIATIHGIVIGFVVFMLGVPLVLPLAVLVFLGSFIPLLGAILAGGVAVLIALGTQGWVAGLILLGVLIAENQLEGNLLQPLIMGRYVRLHPLAIGLVLAVGTILVGLVGAIIAVPAAAVANRVWPALTGRDGQSEEGEESEEPPRTPDAERRPRR